jgi:hypothetical protein
MKENIAKIRPACINRYVSLNQTIGFYGKSPDTYGLLYFEGKIPNAHTQQVGL